MSDPCSVVIYPASRERHNKPWWPYARNCLRPAFKDGLCWQHSHMAVIDETPYRDALRRSDKRNT